MIPPVHMFLRRSSVGILDLLLLVTNVLGTVPGSRGESDNRNVLPVLLAVPRTAHFRLMIEIVCSCFVMDRVPRDHRNFTPGSVGPSGRIRDASRYNLMNLWLIFSTFWHQTTYRRVCLRQERRAGKQESSGTPAQTRPA